jgi:hypothetical protein
LHHGRRHSDPPDEDTRVEADEQIAELAREAKGLPSEPRQQRPALRPA